MMVQIAVSEEQVRAPEIKDILRSCEAAVRLAAQWLTTRLSYESERDLNILANVRKALRH